MFSLRTDCQHLIYSSVQNGFCLFALAWQAVLLSQTTRESDTRECQPEVSVHCSFRDCHTHLLWCQLLTVAGCCMLQCYPLFSPSLFYRSHCPLICLRYYSGCTDIYPSLEFLMYLPIFICSLQSLFLCWEEDSLKCWTFWYCKVVSAGIRTASALSAFRKCFFNNTH